MWIANKMWSKLNDFNVIRPRNDYQLGSILLKLLITTEPKSRLSEVTLPNSFRFYFMLGYGITLTLTV
jgi:hypothetical protein